MLTLIFRVDSILQTMTKPKHVNVKSIEKNWLCRKGEFEFDVQSTDKYKSDIKTKVQFSMKKNLLHNGGMSLNKSAVDHEISKYISIQAVQCNEL